MSLNSAEKGSKEFEASPTIQRTFEADPRQTEDVFGDETNHDIQYKTLSWQVCCPHCCRCTHGAYGAVLHSQFVSLLMIAEIVSNGMLSLPNAMAVVGRRCLCASMASF